MLAFVYFHCYFCIFVCICLFACFLISFCCRFHSTNEGEYYKTVVNWGTNHIGDPQSPTSVIHVCFSDDIRSMRPHCRYLSAECRLLMTNAIVWHVLCHLRSDNQARYTMKDAVVRSHALVSCYVWIILLVDLSSE